MDGTRTSAVTKTKPRRPTTGACTERLGHKEVVAWRIGPVN